MRSRINEIRGFWLVGGILMGLGIAYFWPHEPIRADHSDRADKFMMCTVPASTAFQGIAGSEAVFILDFLTGRLQGFYLSPQVRGFTQSYFRDIAADFQLDQKGAAQPMYSMVAGQGQVTGEGVTWGASLVYVAELTTGQLVAYAFPYTAQNQRIPTQQMVIVDKAEFKKPIAQ